MEVEMPIPDPGQQTIERYQFTPEVYPDNPIFAPAAQEDNTMKKKILIVDDDPKIFKILSVFMKKYNYHIDAAWDAEEAFTKISIGKPDLIITDSTVPEMKEFEFIDKLKESPETEDIPFIFISDRKDPVDQLKGLRMGAKEYFTKPFEVKSLLQTIKNVLVKAEDHLQHIKNFDFIGNLSVMGIEDIVQIAEMNQNTGELVFTTRKEQVTIGSLFFENGRLIHAVSNEHTGKEAFYDLASEKEGYVKFLSSSVKVPATISEQTMGLIFEAKRMEDESKYFYNKIDDIDIKLKVRPRGIPIQIVRAIGKKWVKKIIEMIKDEKTIREIIQSGEMSRLRTVSVISELLSAKAVFV